MHIHSHRELGLLDGVTYFEAMNDEKGSAYLEKEAKDGMDEVSFEYFDNLI